MKMVRRSPNQTWTRRTAIPQTIEPTRMVAAYRPADIELSRGIKAIGPHFICTSLGSRIEAIERGLNIMIEILLGVIAVLLLATFILLRQGLSALVNLGDAYYPKIEDLQKEVAKIARETELISVSIQLREKLARQQYEPERDWADGHP